MKKLLAITLALVMSIVTLAFAEEETTEAPQPQEGQTIVVCAGDSITAAGYPEELGKILGDEFFVSNCGQPGAQMTSGARFSYMDVDKYKKSIELKGDMYIVMLGTNDAQIADFDPEVFKSDYMDLLDSYEALGDDTEVVVMIPPTLVKSDNPRELSYRFDLEVLDQIRSIVAEIGTEREIQVIDLCTLNADHPEWSNDGIHPNEEGNKEFAQFIYDEIWRAE